MCFPRGVLLSGPAGVGKSLLAEALAGETSSHSVFLSAAELTVRWAWPGSIRGQVTDVCLGVCVVPVHRTLIGNCSLHFRRHERSKVC